MPNFYKAKTPKYFKDIREIMEFLEAHEVSHPSHGYNCSCMDDAIRAFRNMTAANDGNIKVQRRIDYIIHTVFRNRY